MLWEEWHFIPRVDPERWLGSGRGGRIGCGRGVVLVTVYFGGNQSWSVALMVPALVWGSGGGSIGVSCGGMRRLGWDVDIVVGSA